jgi:hypothetical protein
LADADAPGTTPGPNAAHHRSRDRLRYLPASGGGNDLLTVNGLRVPPGDRGARPYPGFVDDIATWISDDEMSRLKQREIVQGGRTAYGLERWGPNRDPVTTPAWRG